MKKVKSQKLGTLPLYLAIVFTRKILQKVYCITYIS